MLRFLPSGPVAGWSLAWGIGAAFLIATGASHGWSEGGLALGFAGALAGWMVGALATLRVVDRLNGPVGSPRGRRLMVGWALAFGVAFGASWWLGDLAEELNSMGFVGLIAGVAVGGALGGLLLVALSPPLGSAPGKVPAAALLIVGWAAGFGLGAWVALIGSVYLGEFVKRALEPLLGWYPGLVLGSGVGGSLGGAVAGAVGRATLGAAYGRQ